MKSPEASKTQVLPAKNEDRKGPLGFSIHLERDRRTCADIPPWSCQGVEAAMCDLGKLVSRTVKWWCPELDEPCPVRCPHTLGSQTQRGVIASSSTFLLGSPASLGLPSNSCQQRDPSPMLLSAAPGFQLQRPNLVWCPTPPSSVPLNNRGVLEIYKGCFGGNTMTVTE